MKLLKFAVLLLVFPVLTFSQSFMPSFSNPGGKTNEGYVVKQNGDTLNGKFTFIFTVENIKKLTVKDAQGEKHKLETGHISKVFIKVQKLAKFAALDEASLEKLQKTDYKKIGKSPYYIYERAVTPKKGKVKVMQLVNLGFHSKMKVYRNPTSGETGSLKIGGVKLTGGIEKSYYIVRTGAEAAVEIRKKDYKKQFYTLFGNDCPDLLNALDGKKPDWDDFPLHVFIYDQKCE